MTASPIALGESPDARELHRNLLAAVAEGGEVRLDASEVKRMPAGCIQLLAAARAELAPLGRKLVVLNPSFPFGIAFEALGFEGESELFTVEYA